MANTARASTTTAQWDAALFVALARAAQQDAALFVVLARAAERAFALANDAWASRHNSRGVKRNNEEEEKEEAAERRLCEFNALHFASTAWAFATVA